MGGGLVCNGQLICAPRFLPWHTATRTCYRRCCKILQNGVRLYPNTVQGRTVVSLPSSPASPLPLTLYCCTATPRTSLETKASTTVARGTVHLCISLQAGAHAICIYSLCAYAPSGRPDCMCGAEQQPAASCKRPAVASLV